MNRIMIASSREGAGKTSIIVGIADVANKKIGYMKPFGDRLTYRKKRLWDYDSALMTKIFFLEENPEDMSLGFNHSKIMFMYNEQAIQEKLHEMALKTGSKKDILIIEAGMDLTYGISVFLDPMAVARTLGTGLIVVLAGNEGTVLDDLSLIKRSVKEVKADFKGVIINKVPDVQDFKDTYGDTMDRMGIPVLGIVPFEEELTYFNMQFLAEKMFAKIVAGENGLRNIVHHVFVGAMSAEAALKTPLFRKPKKLIITSGDREDMILAAIESDTSGVILTNNILPKSHLIAKATLKKIPLLVVPYDTIHASRELDKLEPLLTNQDVRKRDLLADLVKRYVDVEKIIGNVVD